MTWHKEQPEHLEAERLVASNLEKVWDCKLVKLKNRYSADYAALTKDHKLDDRVSALIEIKVRPNIKSTTYPTAIADINKIKNMNSYSSIIHDCPSFLVYQWQDKAAYIALAAPYQVQFMGRTDRGEDERDLYAQFKIEDFKTLWNGYHYQPKEW